VELVEVVVVQVLLALPQLIETTVALEALAYSG
jgi:hypothetical protein